MRACFLGQNVTALGYGIAMLQTPPLPEVDALPDKPSGPPAAAQEAFRRMEDDYPLPVPAPVPIL